MIATHLQVVSKQPAQACNVPITPDFITTFQCFGQFFQSIFGTLTGGGLDTLSGATGSIVGLLSNVLFLFTKGLPTDVTVDPGNMTP